MLDRLRSAAALCCALVVAACASGAEDAAEHMARAREYAARSEHRAVMIELKNVLAAQPDNA